MASDNTFPATFGVFGGYSPMRSNVFFNNEQYTVLDLSSVFLEGARNVVIGVDRTTGEKVVLPYKHRDEAVAIIGKTGSGKSSVLERLILADLAAGTPALVIDPHGVLAQRVVGLATPDHAKRIVSLDPSHDPLFGLNLLACSDPDDDKQVAWAADNVVATVKKAYGQADDFIPRLEKYLDLAARTLIPNRLTLAEVPRLFSDKQFRESCVGNVSNSEIRVNLRQRWVDYDRLRPADQVVHIEAVANRLETLLAPKYMQLMLGSSDTTVPFDQILNGQTILIMTLRSEELAAERCNVIGAMLLAEFAKRLFSRRITASAEPPRVHVYVDEYERFATTTTAELLTQGRKFGAGVTLAYQNLSQISDEKIRGAARGTGTLIVLRGSRLDADEIAGEYPLNPKPQSTEMLTVLDGKERVRVPTLAPATHLATNGHNDPAVRDAARRLFAEGNKEPKERQVRDEVAIPSDDPIVNTLFVDVMYGQVSNLRQRLLEILYTFSEGRVEGGYWVYRGTHLWLTEGTHAAKPGEARSALESWLKVHLNHKDEFLQGVKPPRIPGFAIGRSPKTFVSFRRFGPHGASDAFLAADNALLAFALEHWEWTTNEVAKDMANPEFSPRCELATLRERMRCIVIICEGLVREPILDDSGQEKDHYKEVVINHPAQTQQDALNEFSSRLVNPTEQWVAHVKLPIGYHEVKLKSPIEGTENREQIEEVRNRSQEHCRAKRRPEPQIRPAEEAADGVAPGDTPVAESVQLYNRIGRRSPSGGADA